MEKKNRIHKVRKPQGDSKKVLCVCSAGMLRSPTAANILQILLGYNTRSAGIVERWALIMVTDKLVKWADEIVCMTPDHVDMLRAKFELWQVPQEWQPPIICLGIEDEYNYMDEELQLLIVENYTKLQVDQDQSHSQSETPAQTS
jgi:predicted protein tyrosine phosphatase